MASRSDGITRLYEVPQVPEATMSSCSTSAACSICRFWH